MKVAIIGYTPHRVKAPWGPEHRDWELWLLNDLYMQHLPALDPKRVRWFELHPWDVPAPDGQMMTYSVDRAHTQVMRKLAQDGATVYLKEERPEMPEAKRFPYEAIYEYYKDTVLGDRKYFTNTISFQIALAIMDGATEIGIYGVDMMTGGGGGVNNEYSWQRPSCEAWIGFAEGRGIKVHIPVESDLMSSAFVYGDYVGNAYRTKLEHEMKNCEQAIGQVQAQLSQLGGQLQQYMGRKGTLEWQLRAWMPGDNGLGDGRAPMPGANQGPAVSDLQLTQPDGGLTTLRVARPPSGPVNRLSGVLSDSNG